MLMTCEEYRNIVEVNEEVTEEIVDQMDEHELLCPNGCEELFYKMFEEILGIDPDIDPEDLFEIGKQEGWAE